jgi:hypothetical protein
VAVLEVLGRSCSNTSVAAADLGVSVWRWVRIDFGRRFEERSDDLGVDVVAVTGRRGPDEPAGFGLLYPPAVMCVVVVMGTVCWAEVVVGGGTALGEWHDVIEVARLSRPGAGRK